MAAMEMDTDRVLALVTKTDRVFTGEEARTIATYARTVADLKKNSRPKSGDNDDLDIDQLIEEASKNPLIRDAVMRSQDADLHDKNVEDAE